jgi:glutamine---fructose-6-phosphate transaminase (isomerizing)
MLKCRQTWFDGFILKNENVVAGLMCGIFGYIGKRNGVHLALDGLKKMEYRGYDSAGICFVEDGHLVCRKAIGKLKNLLDRMQDDESSSCVIAHTRWATHGKVTEENAHPILDSTGAMAVVHNGVIENYQQLRSGLEKQGVIFHSETDTEVISNLISALYKGDLLQAVLEVTPLIKGAWAIVVIHKDHPGELIAARKSSPLVLGIGLGEMFVASDPNALVQHTKEVLYLGDGEVARITATNVELFDENKSPVSKKTEILKHCAEEISKGDFEHFTLKEIFDQPQAILNALAERYHEESGTVCFEDLKIKPSELLAVKKILIVACGTSYHAGLIASYMLEEIARISTSVEISSEFRYRNPIVEDGTLVLAISQSGETADTIAAVRELQAKGAKIIAICNVQNSTLTREADSTLFLRAGPEIGVCSTKAFTSQLTVLTLFTLMMARLRHMGKLEGRQFLRDLMSLPEQVSSILAQSAKIEQIAEKYYTYNDCYFIGRRYMYPTCLEGALKLKEIAYVNACGYAAGEMKHGPIALLNEKCPTFALCADMVVYDKVVGNLMEAKARRSPVIAVVFEGDERVLKIADDCIMIPRVRDELAPITTAVVCQLYSYYCAKKRGADIDQPKNLAKSVTVE